MEFDSRSLGICIGASSIKLVGLAATDGLAQVETSRVVYHECNTRDCLLELLEEHRPADYDYVCITGRKFKDLVDLPVTTEPEASEYALRYVLAGRGSFPAALVSLGSESFILYQLNEEGAIVGVRTGNKCASGTGEFFLQQVGRMELTAEQAAHIGRGAEPYSVSGRCSVFCKSDCTHALNKGIPKEQVCAGLGNMMAEKVLELLAALPQRDVMLVGGVTCNAYLMDRLEEAVEGLMIPEHAEVFEALGAALYALDRKCRHRGPVLLRQESASFSRLPPLREAAPLVSFREHPRGKARPGDETLLGLDVGSTTTKAVLTRRSDDEVLASVYLRTGGDPVGAARHCYREILRQLDGAPVSIVGLGVTGSGRHIAGLHAQTDAVINEIIAHATAAAHFDPEVDTILEIGGQDAKYTYLVNGVPCDYAMNEACSAGTGSFLEEAARESLNIDVRQIEGIALAAETPPNFNDQCAAFISADIKTAAHEMGRDDIVAGLVYSIAMNYNNRVKGARKVGRKVFMQGGVCYNRAVPLAMAALLKQEIVVPPEPGLMGAFGVALEVKQRLAGGQLAPAAFDLAALAAREVSYGRSFTCPGTQERCDRGCAISVVELEGRRIPFGGTCNKYYNLAHHVRIDPEPLDYVARRQRALFAELPAAPRKGQKTVALARSFLTNLLYPLYYHFFRELGFAVVLSDGVDADGLKAVNAAFCFPAQLAHGMVGNLLGKQPDYLFLPQVSELFVEGGTKQNKGRQSTCVIVQAEPHYIRSAFKDADTTILSPVLNFAAGWETMETAFAAMAEEMGCEHRRAAAAYRAALARQREFFAQRRALGQEVLERLAADPEAVGVVVFGRPYNAYADEANMGIPRKFASRGVYVLPFDVLPFQEQPPAAEINWALAKDLLRAARFVKEQPQLFAAFVTNFSCGPDAFVVGYVRDIMKTKPSLTLEIDSHTADAGVNTRVEAFLDIVDRYRRAGVPDPEEPAFRRAELVLRNGRSAFVDSDGRNRPLTDPKVQVVFPSMGRTLSELGAAVFEGFGVRSRAVPMPDFETLMCGRANASCKECLPLLLTTGSLLEYVRKRDARSEDGEELLVYFMPTTNGNCRFAQYSVFLNKLIEKQRLRNVATFTLTSENSYGGLGPVKATRFLRAAVVADVMDDIRNALAALAVDREAALREYDRQWRQVLACFRRGGGRLFTVLGEAAARLGAIPLTQPFREAKKVLLAGEIFVRKDEFSSGGVVERLARRGIVVQRAPLLEWLRYIDHWTQRIERPRFSLVEMLEHKVRMITQNRQERKIKRVLGKSGLCEPEFIRVDEVIEFGRHFVSEQFGGETILAVGRFFKDVPEHYDGMISIGPFACLPTRIIESILQPESRVRGNQRLRDLPNHARVEHLANLPFLSVESDGNPLPQIVEAQIEAFCLQVERIHDSRRGRQHPLGPRQEPCRA